MMEAPNFLLCLLLTAYQGIIVDTTSAAAHATTTVITMATVALTMTISPPACGTVDTTSAAAHAIMTVSTMATVALTMTISPPAGITVDTTSAAAHATTTVIAMATVALTMTVSPPAGITVDTTSAAVHATTTVIAMATVALTTTAPQFKRQRRAQVNAIIPSSSLLQNEHEVTHSCMHNCGYNFSSCSCTHDCQYYGNCCPDFHWYCPSDTTESHPQCGGHLYGSGLFSSPNYPSYYHDNAYCVWYLSAQQGQRIFLSFVDVQLERCCNCDYISVYDGSSTGYPLLGKICFNDTTNQVLHSSSRYLTVVFRSDYSGVSHGFKALFTSSLTANEGRVDCSSDNMVIVIQQSYLNSLGYSGNDLYVDDHLCRPTNASSEVVFSFPLDTCGTAKEMMNGYVSYTNNVRASQSQSGEITRQSQFLLHVGCRMEPDTVVQIFYKAKEIINANITGTGRFNASIAFYTSSSFYQQIYDFPYEVKLNQYLYVQVKLNRPDNSLDLFLDTCVASPNPSDFKDRSYDLLRNGCPRDNTYYSYTSGQHYYAQFSFRAFMFLRTHAYVYLQCKVIICPDNDYNSRCRQGCRYRRKRSLDSTYHTNTVTLGPIKLKGRRLDVESEKSKE
ncbi:CUB and zona pellucida-like domain-containing protein 1 [Anabarilius grahami]|uniref:CUB and zona pellucida-like domain-containing protein 1 n=1 Tax=Anabarilius grahami TaxID=495550 RepID=A0A3N0XW22_ANAGA|nr:CUB and zona pellucida-like domain-containing protein 1 [Anabarilius grahami]